jgi:hypothetical protein
LGFDEAGACVLDGRLKSGVRFVVRRDGDERVIYAFAVDDIVKHVGVCDNPDTRLADRMSRYQGRRLAEPTNVLRASSRLRCARAR